MQVLPVLEEEYRFWMNESLGHFLPSLELNVPWLHFGWAIYNDQPAEVTPNGGEK